jgi:hypothetical protein
LGNARIGAFVLAGDVGARGANKRAAAEKSTLKKGAACCGLTQGGDQIGGNTPTRFCLLEDDDRIIGQTDVDNLAGTAREMLEANGRCKAHCCHHRLEVGSHPALRVKMPGIRPGIWIIRRRFL